MKNKHLPLFTIGILSYNNFCYLEEAVASVLGQDYPAIELILSDDGSNDFDEHAIRAFIETNKRDNLVQVTISRMQKNEGTVKNTNNIVRKIAGEYFLFFAADDALYDEQVLSRFVQAFNSLPDEERIVTARAKMCDEHLSKHAYDYPFISLGQYMQTRTVAEQYKTLSVYCIYASGATAYRSQIFKEHGAFDEAYFLVEDLPYWLRLTRAGIRLNFVDFAALLHRDGGVSHPTDDEKPTRTLVLYWKDVTHVMEREVLPYLNRFMPNEQDKCMQHYRLFKDRYVGAVGKEAEVLSAAKRIAMNWKWYARKALVMLAPHFAQWQHKLAKLSIIGGVCSVFLVLGCLLCSALFGSALDLLWWLPMLLLAGTALSLIASGVAWVCKQIWVLCNIRHVKREDL